MCEEKKRLLGCKEVDSLSLEANNVASCVSKGKSEHYDCRNHIRVIQPVGDGNKLYICGTNAHSPRDWVINANLSHLSAYESFPGIGNGIAKCPFDPEDNATAIWVEKGNPSGLPGLYSGSVAEFTKADTVIFRTDLYNLTTGHRVHPFKRTIKYDSKWLDKPHFVGSYDIGDFVYFFFRESAVEYINCGKNIYSRVARVCKRDTGGKNILSKNWASFLKARLNCSIPGEFPFYFNEIQHVYKHPDDDSKFYAVFSTSMNGLIGSAICTFSLESIQEVFNGKFKEQAASSSAWLPVLSSQVPEPRPGVCVNDTQSLSDSVLNFIRGHPLMDSA
ncbi:semaphorin-2A-like protein, partial [Dinothrombium tinctorium]